MLTAGILIIGDEILNGNITDLNSPFLCKRLHVIGIRTCKISTIPDDVKVIAEEVKTFSNSFDLVITTGGVGPTHDDVTYEAVATAFGTTLRVDEKMKKFYSWYIKNHDSSAIKLVSIPSTAEVVMVDLAVPLENDMLIFPIVKTGNVYNFPGIPSYTRTIFDAMEEKHFQNSANLFFSRTIYLNVDEIEALPILNAIVSEFAGRVQFGSYPLYGSVQKHGELTKIYVESSSLTDCLEAEKALLMKFSPQWLVHARSERPDFNIIRRLMASDIQLGAVLRTTYQIIDKCFEKYGISEMFICFNGGKDCTVLLILIYYYCTVAKIQARFKLLYFHDPDSFSEVDSFIEEVKKNYNVDLNTFPLPMKKSLCEFLKMEPTRKVCFLGQRNSDPRSHNLKPMQETDSDWPKLMRIFPLLHWTYKDVWDFIRCANIPYCTLYDQGYTSLGNKSNTAANTGLKIVNCDNSVYYRPAFLLSEDEFEREGRHNRHEDVGF